MTIITSNNNTTQSLSSPDDSKISSQAAASSTGLTPNAVLTGLAAWISAMQNNYVNPANDAFIKSVTFSKDVVKLQQDIASLIKAGTESGKMEMDLDAITTTISTLISKYQEPPASVLYKANATGEAGRAEANDWAKKLGLPASSVQQVKNDDGSITFAVVIDVNPLDQLRNLYEGMKVNISGDNVKDGADKKLPNGKYSIDAATYNAKKVSADTVFQGYTDTASIIGEKVMAINTEGKNIAEIGSTQMKDWGEVLKALIQAMS